MNVRCDEKSRVNRLTFFTVVVFVMVLALVVVAYRAHEDLSVRQPIIEHTLAVVAFFTGAALAAGFLAVAVLELDVVLTGATF